jgi:hypothetical protein
MGVFSQITKADPQFLMQWGVIYKKMKKRNQNHKDACYNQQIQDRRKTPQGQKK